MELNIKDIELYINKILEDFDKTYNIAVHFILLDCIKEVGLNKNRIIANIHNYASNTVLETLSSSSFMAKAYLKNFIGLNTDSRNNLLNKLIEILNKCEEKNGLLVIPEQKKSIAKSKPTVETKKIIEVNDSELGTIQIDCDDGYVKGDTINYNHHKTVYNDLPVDFSVDYEIYGIDDKLAHVHENIEKEKELYINDIKYIHKRIDIIEKFAIEKIWEWFTNVNTVQETRRRYIKLNISLFVHLSNDKYNNSIWLTAGWNFEEDADAKEGYFDFTLNKTNDEFVESDLNYY